MLRKAIIFIAAAIILVTVIKSGLLKKLLLAFLNASAIKALAYLVFGYKAA